MSLRALAASGFCLVVASVLAGACGGKVSSGSSSGSSGSSITPTPLPPPTGRPGRPPPVQTTAASVAADIAEAYCKGFSSCCVGTGQPPIDVARCRQLVAADVEAAVSPDAVLDTVELAPCLDTIKGRIAACGAVDASWWASGQLALIAPGTVTTACSSLFGLEPRGTVTCTSDASCALGAATKCAIDECVAAGPIGASCSAASGCLDGALCVMGTCAAAPDVMVKGACTADDECRLGLVCAKGFCLPSRDYPGLGKSERFSPYRIGADTCRAYTYL